MKIEKILETIAREFTGKALGPKPGDGCFYKNHEGKKCAIGIFIPDGHAAQNFIGGVRDLLRNFPSLWKYMPSSNLEKLSHFQWVHDVKIDTASPIEIQRTELMEAAIKTFGGEENDR